MLLEAAHRLGAYPLRGLVKVDDSTVGIEAGLNAGCWTVGIVRTGNLMGKSVATLAAMDASEVTATLEAGREAMRGAGAHFVIDSVAELMPIIETIEARLAHGERP
jgi:phosphonoacetaldehyde hydrolase